MPFFAFMGFLAALGSTSVVIARLQRLQVLDLVLVRGTLFKRLSSGTRAVVLCQIVTLGGKKSTRSAHLFFNSDGFPIPLEAILLYKMKAG